MKQDPVHAYKQQQRKEVRLPQYLSIITAYENFKHYEFEPGIFKQDKLDFTDMIKKFITDGIVPHLDVLMVDEAQDLTPLQWDLISKLAVETKIVYLAGDDDQAIYEWNGADVDFFIHFPGKNKILKQSRRIPKAIHSFSNLLMAPAKGYRVEKEFMPKKEEGTVNTYPDIKKIKFNNDQSYMVLTRIRDVKSEVEKDLKDMGLYFQDVQGVRSFKIEQWQAIKSWNKVISGGSITREEACIMYHYLQNIDHGFRSADSSKWSFAHENQPFNYDELQLRCGLREDKDTWIKSFKIRFSNKEKEYFIKALNNKFDLDQKSNIIVDTMHAVKGGEADNVVLLSKANWPSHYERKNILDKVKECRVWYVGATRAKQNLHLVNTHHKYHFPLGSIYNIFRRNYDTQRLV
jgi:DNA helicase-2/ATP-dependent DNA helicase PcrA